VGISEILETVEYVPEILDNNLFPITQEFCGVSEVLDNK
jgi:hypothetical protein